MTESRPTLAPHQVAELDFLLRTPRALLASETGTGKTPSLLRYVDQVLSAGGTVVWVTEAGLIEQLREESGRWLAEPNANPPIMLKGLGGQSQFSVVSFHMLTKLVDGLLSPTLVVVDEAHRMVPAEGTSVSSGAVMQLIARSERSVLVTATPVRTVHGLDLRTLMSVGRIPGTPSEATFDRAVWYRDTPIGGGRFKRVPAGIANWGIDLLAEPLRMASVRSRVSDLGLHIPEMIRSSTPVGLAPAEMRNYQAASKGATGLHGFRAKSDAARACEGLLDVAVEAALDLIAAGHLHPIVFSERLVGVDTLVDKLQLAGVSVWKLTGNESKSRHEVISKHRDAALGVLVGSEVLQTGLNLQYSDALISVQSTWSSSDELQREGRIRRAGSRFDVVRHDRFYPDVPIEHQKTNRLQQKIDFMQRILDQIPTTSCKLEIA